MSILTNPEPSVATTCRAHGDGWSCDKPLKYTTLQLCHGHYCQHWLGKEFTEIKPRATRRPALRHDLFNTIPSTHKRCVTCNETKHESMFHTGASECKECSADRSTNIRHGKGAAAWKKEKLAEQGGLCALCKSDMYRMHLDHDHKTGKRRGVLCQICNMILGHIEGKGWNHVEFTANVDDYLKNDG